MRQKVMRGIECSSVRGKVAAAQCCALLQVVGFKNRSVQQRFKRVARERQGGGAGVGW